MIKVRLRQLLVQMARGCQNVAPCRPTVNKVSQYPLMEKVAPPCQVVILSSPKPPVVQTLRPVVPLAVNYTWTNSSFLLVAATTKRYFLRVPPNIVGEPHECATAGRVSNPQTISARGRFHTLITLGAASLKLGLDRNSTQFARRGENCSHGKVA